MKVGFIAKTHLGREHLLAECRTSWQSAFAFAFVFAFAFAALCREIQRHSAFAFTFAFAFALAERRPAAGLRPACGRPAAGLRPACGPGWHARCLLLLGHALLGCFLHS